MLAFKVTVPVEELDRVEPYGFLHPLTRLVARLQNIDSVQRVDHEHIFYTCQIGGRPEYHLRVERKATTDWFDLYYVRKEVERVRDEFIAQMSKRSELMAA